MKQIYLVIESYEDSLGCREEPIVAYLDIDKAENHVKDLYEEQAEFPMYKKSKFYVDVINLIEDSSCLLK